MATTRALASSQGFNEATEASFPPTDDANEPPPYWWMVTQPTKSEQPPAEDTARPRAMWPPSTVIQEDRGKATAMWVILLALFAAYVGYLAVNASEMRKNPPVQIRRKEEPFPLPDVVLCPSAGDGCDADDGVDCLPMNWYISTVEGLSGCNEFFAPTPAPTPAPTQAPTIAPAVGAAPPTGGYYSDDSFWYSSGRDFSDDWSASPGDDGFEATPSPVVVPSIRVQVATRANELCPRVPLSECAIDYDRVEAGDVRSLHASFYVLWNDTVSSTPVSSARRFINMFFVDEETDVTDAVVAVRLPYDRVNITGTDPFTFLSNDVILSMSQYVHLNYDGNVGSTERTYTQATTTAQHTLQLDTFEGKSYEGALVYVTLSVNTFAYQSIEEVDPVDWGTLLGSAGGMWEIICFAFAACFVASQVVDPDKKWGWKTFGGICRGVRNKT